MSRRLNRLWLLPVLLLASQSWALGLGNIRLSSALNEPLRAEIDLPPQILAPLSTEQAIGEIRVSLDERLIAQQPLYPLANIPLGGFFDRAIDEIKLWFD